MRNCMSTLNLHRNHRLGQKKASSNKPRAVIINSLPVIRKKKHKKKTFERNTSQHYRKFNSQENGNFEEGKGKTPISQRVDLRW